MDIDNTLLEADLEASLSLEPICRGRIGAPMLVKGHISSCRTSLQFRREHGWQKGKEPWPKELLKKDKDEVDALYALFKIKEAQQKQAEARERNEEAQQKESEA